MKTISFDRWVISLSFIICHFTFSPVAAQTFTQQLQKQRSGEGKVVLYHDAAIDKLVNGPQAAAAKTTKAATKPAATKKTEQKQQQQTPTPNKPAPNSDTTTTPTGEQTQAIDSINSKARRTYRTNGYRVQVYAGGNSRHDRQKAEQIGNQLRSLYPGEQVYVHFYSPRWICRIGNYRSKDEAKQMKNSLMEMGFGTTTIVKGKITLPY